MNNNIGSSNQRVEDLIHDVLEKKLILRPFFQRRQVWNNADKEKFIDTIIQEFPFPEIFVAIGDADDKTSRRKKMLVDGQQRVSTLLAYYEGSDELLYRTIPRFMELQEEQRAAFLDYRVAVRDLGTASNKVIREIFSRINSTDYALKQMEILNAMYSGFYKQFCEQLSRDIFFERHKVFPAGHRKRMYDLTFCVILVTTLLSGYYKRDERNKEYLDRYNEEFPQTDSVRVGIDKVFDFVERCGFPDGSRAWKQTDLFTLLVETHTAIVVDKLELEPVGVGQRVQAFFDKVNGLFTRKRTPDAAEVPQEATPVFTYLMAATKATSDKYARVVRAGIISELIRDSSGGEAAAEKVKTKPVRSRKK